MKQRTLAKAVEIVGIGLHKGVPVKMKLEPLEADAGIIFYRVDAGVTIPLSIENVVDTKMATVIGKDGIVISTIEHLVSALYAGHLCLDDLYCLRLCSSKLNQLNFGNISF